MADTAVAARWASDGVSDGTRLVRRLDELHAAAWRENDLAKRSAIEADFLRVNGELQRALRGEPAPRMRDHALHCPAWSGSVCRCGLRGGTA